MAIILQTIIFLRYEKRPKAIPLLGMKRILQQPFPSYHFSQRQILISIGSGILIFLVFYLAQPFNINKLSEPLQLVYSLAYAGVTAVGLLLLTVVFPLVFPSIFEEKEWIVAKEVVFVGMTLLVIAAGNILANHWLEGAAINIESFLKFLMATVLIGIFPITFSVLLKQQVLLKRYSEEAQNLNKQLHSQQVFVQPISGDGFLQRNILLQGDNQEEQLEVDPQNLWQLSTADNYVNILYKDGAIIKKILLRSPLKKMEDSLKEHSSMIRCHRSHIVNIEKVEKVIATAQGLKLKLQQQDQLVPVGKTYTDSVKARLKQE
jgi:DNA-binding LytR/AlgR family response regulator